MGYGLPPKIRHKTVDKLPNLAGERRFFHCPEIKQYGMGIFMGVLGNVCRELGEAKH